MPGPGVLCPVARLGKRGRTISADEAKRRRLAKGSLYCLDPLCSTPVFPRVGGAKRPHFAHYDKGDAERCGGGIPKGETMEHLLAKHFIAENNRWCYFVDWKCGACKRAHGVRGTWEMQASVEHRVDVGGGRSRVADVMLLDDRGPVYAVEVRQTHAVEPEKEKELRAVGISVLEVDASAVIEEMEMNEGRHFARGSLRHGLRLVDAPDVLCPDCLAGELANKELTGWAEHEMLYDRAVRCFIDAEFDGERVAKARRRHQIQVYRETRDAMNKIVTEELNAWAEHERIYNWAVRRFIEVTFEEERAATERRLKRRQHKILISRGINTASKMAVEVYKDPLFHKSEFVKGESFKCVGCSKWRLEDPDTLDNSRFYSIGEFRDANPWLQDKGSDFVLRRYATGVVNICHFCAMPCPACGDTNTMQGLSKYGCCFECNVQSKMDAD